MFCLAVIRVFFSFFVIILKEKRVPVALLSLSSWCIVAINVLWLFLMIHCVDIQCVIVVFPDHTYLLQSVVICIF